MGNRYQAEGVEAEFEPGSRKRVLHNLLGIHRVREMGLRETEALLAATQQLIDETGSGKRFTANDFRGMHRLWLGDIYSWAGEYRGVNMAIGGFMFAAAGQIPRLMQKLEQGPLRKFTPCHSDNLDEQAMALAVVHTELILIHPFRDGNGRCARLLATLMGLQSGLPALDFGGVRGKEKKRYIALYCCGSRRAGSGLRADVRGVSSCYRPDFEVARWILTPVLLSRIGLALVKYAPDLAERG